MCFKRIEVHPFLSSMYLKLHILPFDFLSKPVAEVLRPHLRQLRYLHGAQPSDYTTTYLYAVTAITVGKVCDSQGPSKNRWRNLNPDRKTLKQRSRARTQSRGCKPLALSRLAYGSTGFAGFPFPDCGDFCGDFNRLFA